MQRERPALGRGSTKRGGSKICNAINMSLVCLGWPHRLGASRASTRRTIAEKNKTKQDKKKLLAPIYCLSSSSPSLSASLCLCLSLSVPAYPWNDMHNAHFTISFGFARCSLSLCATCHNMPHAACCNENPVAATFAVISLMIFCRCLIKSFILFHFFVFV